MSRGDLHVHHHTEVRFFGHQRGYQAFCITRDCGWESPWFRKTEQEAIDDGTDHEVEAVK